MRILTWIMGVMVLAESAKVGATAPVIPPPLSDMNPPNSGNFNCLLFSKNGYPEAKILSIPQITSETSESSEETVCSVMIGDKIHLSLPSDKPLEYNGMIFAQEPLPTSPAYHAEYESSNPLLPVWNFLVTTANKVRAYSTQNFGEENHCDKLVACTTGKVEVRHIPFSTIQGFFRQQQARKTLNDRSVIIDSVDQQTPQSASHRKDHLTTQPVYNPKRLEL